MNAGREARAITSIIVSLDSVRTDARRAIEMDGNETCTAVRVGDGAPGPQGNENVGIPGHDHAIPLSLQDSLQALGDIQGLIFLTDPLAGHAAAIEPAMAGVDYDGAGLAKGGSSQSCQTGKGREDQSGKIHRKKVTRSNRPRRWSAADLIISERERVSFPR